MAGRIGIFFLFIGLIILVIFFGTDQVRQPAYGLFCLGTAVSGFGFLIVWKNRRPPTPSKRFRMIRRLRNEDREEKEE